MAAPRAIKTFEENEFNFVPCRLVVIEGRGRGVIASTRIPKGTMVALFPGEEVWRVPNRNESVQQPRVLDDVIGRCVVPPAVREKCSSWSDNPDDAKLSAYLARPALFAQRDVEAGEELTIYYRVGAGVDQRDAHVPASHYAMQESFCIHAAESTAGASIGDVVRANPGALKYYVRYLDPLADPRAALPPKVDAEDALTRAKQAQNAHGVASSVRLFRHAQRALERARAAWVPERHLSPRLQHHIFCRCHGTRTECPHSAVSRLQRAIAQDIAQETSLIEVVHDECKYSFYWDAEGRALTGYASTHFSGFVAPDDPDAINALTHICPSCTRPVARDLGACSRCAVKTSGLVEASNVQGRVERCGVCGALHSTDLGGVTIATKDVDGRVVADGDSLIDFLRRSHSGAAALQGVSYEHAQTYERFLSHVVDDPNFSLTADYPYAACFVNNAPENEANMKVASSVDWVHEALSTMGA